MIKFQIIDRVETKQLKIGVGLMLMQGLPEIIVRKYRACIFISAACQRERIKRYIKPPKK